MNGQRCEGCFFLPQNFVSAAHVGSAGGAPIALPLDADVNIKDVECRVRKRRSALKVAAASPVGNQSRHTDTTTTAARDARWPHSRLPRGTHGDKGDVGREHGSFSSKQTPRGGSLLGRSRDGDCGEKDEAEKAIVLRHVPWQALS